MRAALSSGHLGRPCPIPLELRQCWTPSLASALGGSLKPLEDIYFIGLESCLIFTKKKKKKEEDEEELKKKKVWEHGYSSLYPLNLLPMALG
jgi:hypothetical protein